MSKVIFALCAVYIVSCAGFSGFGPNVKQSYGEPWPMPQVSEKFGDQFMIVRPALFRFQITNFTCDMVELALKRYYRLLLNNENEALLRNHIHNAEDTHYRGHLDTLEINLQSACEYMPHKDMDESYKLKIDTPSNPKKGVLIAKTNWGILRGLETFSQLVHHDPSVSSLRVKSCRIHDYPTYPFRSVLLDTSRHFLSRKVLLQNLDLMAMNKMNVFHWHIVDDQSFPYQSKAFPDLSDKGAFAPYTHVYTRQDILEIIEYARLRGIRVIPEFDTPGHTQSWGPAIPNLLTKCYKNDSKGVPHPDGTFGPIDPTVAENYDFIRTLFTEVAKLFPDQYIHLGGDEVDFSCWESNPDITAFMIARNLSSYAELEELYIRKAVEITKSLHKSPILWQEVFDNGAQISGDAVINVWKSQNLSDELHNVTRAGYRTLLYSCWYLDVISWNIDWPKYYNCDPRNFTGTSAQKNLVEGGGAALWGEFVDSTNVIARLWPRASAPAEKLWSSSNLTDVKEAAPRLEEHRCRLLSRGYTVQPANGPGFCNVSWD